MLKSVFWLQIAIHSVLQDDDDKYRYTLSQLFPLDHTSDMLKFIVMSKIECKNITIEEIVVGSVKF